MQGCGEPILADGEGGGVSGWRFSVTSVHVSQNEVCLPEHTLRASGVPQFGPNCFDTPVVDDADIEGWLITGALESLVPFTVDLSLVVEKDSVAVNLQSHRVAFKVEVELHEGNDVLLWPASLCHVVEQAGSGYRHLAPRQIFIRNCFVGWLVGCHGL